MQAARADVLGGLVHLRGKFRNFLERVVGEIQLDALGLEERRVLFGEGILRLFENADEIFDGERLQLHANREAALKFRNEVARLGDMEGSRGDEEDVVGAHETVSRVYGSPFHNREDI